MSHSINYDLRKKNFDLKQKNFTFFVIQVMLVSMHCYSKLMIKENNNNNCY